jgi:hypothetical protein
MPLKTKEITIDDPESRDNGKCFFLKEMSAYKAEKWAMKAILALMKGGVQIPDSALRGGVAGLLEVQSILFSALGNLTWETAEPLLDEMLSCVSVIPDPSKSALFRPLNLNSADIEEMSTLFLLRKEVFALHTNFFKAAAGQKSAAGAVGNIS